MKTLERYLRDAYAEGAIDHEIRCEISETGVKFYIHPHGTDGETCDYVVSGNQLSPDPSVDHQADAR